MCSRIAPDGFTRKDWGHERCLMCGRSRPEGHADGCPRMVTGSVIRCPKCKGDGYREIGDVYTEGVGLAAAAEECDLCYDDGARAGWVRDWYDGPTATGRIALPLAPAIVAYNDEQGEDWLIDFYQWRDPEEIAASNANTNEEENAA